MTPRCRRERQRRRAGTCPWSWTPRPSRCSTSVLAPSRRRSCPPASGRSPISPFALIDGASRHHMLLRDFDHLTTRGFRSARLVRKSDFSWARGIPRWRGSATGGGGGGSGGCGQQLAGVWVDGLDGDVVAEAFEAADVVAGLAADVHALFVIAGAEVLVAGAGVREQGMEDGQDGVAGGDEGFLFGHALDKPPVFGAEEGLGAAGADADF